MYATRFDEVLSFHEPGLAAVRLGGAGWHIREDGSPVYDKRYVRVFGFYDHRAAVVDEGGWVHIAPSGEEAYRDRFAWCGNFQEGLCTVRSRDGAYRHIDLEGVAVHGRDWRYAGDFRYSVAVVQRDDGLSTHITRNGKLVHERWFVDLDVFHKAFARARDEEGWMHVDRRGVPVYARRFATVEPFYNGQARVERFDGSREIIDEAGSTLVQLRGVTHD